ncbi:PIN domain-containing protein [Aquirhabdus parva]|uniref:DUF4935 domain-containing protein n=1 Tax=Aquirhabdus parva TaxID=2283318 RepID=A0A345P845_9GAMM|nr:PIN domain-containing protein [Aquirhabdus parva]AXI03454.1 hypothetical protein HYN46_11750 [Aquirhabdus parva]
MNRLTITEEHNEHAEGLIVTSSETKYDALTIDTNTFFTHGMLLKHGILKQLEQFSDSPIKLIFPDVVFREIGKHLAEKISDVVRNVNATIKSAHQYLEVDEDTLSKFQIFFDIGSPENFSHTQLESFKIRCGARVITAKEYVDMHSLLELYFSTSYPFEDNGKKKNEFPDAIALLTLESWAAKNNFRVLAVSKDKGWNNYCKTSETIDCYEDLVEAISYLLSQTPSISQVFRQSIERIILEIQIALMDDSKSDSELNDRLGDVISEYVENSAPSIVADIDVDFDIEEARISYLSHTFVSRKYDLPTVKLVNLKDNKLVFNTRCEIFYVAEATCNFFVWNPIQKNRVLIESKQIYHDSSYITNVLISFDFDSPTLKLSELKLENIEIEDSIDYLDFGTLKPEITF